MERIYGKQKGKKKVKKKKKRFYLPIGGKELCGEQLLNITQRRCATQYVGS